MSSYLYYLFAVTLLVTLYQGVNAGTTTDSDLSSSAEWGASGCDSYDFIVVGAGASGPVIAARLSAQNGWNVLLLEAGGRSSAGLGGDDYVATEFKKDPATGKVVRSGYFTRVDVPIYTPSLLDPAVELEYNWNTTNTGGASIGRTLGGSQAHNGMNWAKPTTYDIQRWNITGWAPSQFFPYIARAENYTGSGFVLNSYSGLTGPLQIRKTAVITPLDQTFVNASIAAGIPFNPTPELVVGTAVSAQNIGSNGTAIRQTTALKYLGPIQGRRTLTISIYSQVIRVLTKTVNGKPTAYGVQYIKTINGRQTKQTATADKEVILCGGAIQTTKILILSGIGPAAQLRTAGVTPVVVNENVGRNLRNQLFYVVSYTGIGVNPPNMGNTAAEEINYGVNGAGLFATNAAQGGVITLVKTNKNLVDPDVGLLLFTANASPFTRGVTVGVVANTPEYNFGTVTVASGNPLAEPIFNPNLQLVSSNDISTLVKGVQILRNITSQAVARPVFGAETFPGASVSTTAQLTASVRSNVGNIYHYYGSAKMGNNGDPLRVVDPNLNVVGVNNLRVADSSIIPNPVNYLIQATIVGIGEKAATLIASSWS